MTDLSALSIEYATNVRRDLVDLLTGQDPISIDFSGIETLDLSGLQLLVSLLREAEKKKKAIHFFGDLSESVRHFVTLSGVADCECQTGEQLENALKAVS